jgi:hypothetical protein
MDTVTLVEDQIDDGRLLVERFVADGGSVTAAFWVKTAEEGQWFLYIATEGVDRDGPAAAYRTVYASLKKLGDPWIALSEIKLVGPENPITKSVLEILARHPRRSPIRFGGKSLGNLSVEEAYIYPPRIFVSPGGNRMTTNEVIQHVIQLMNRTGVVQASAVTLQDGTAFRGFPFGLELGNNQMEVKFIDEATNRPRAIPAVDIACIQ